MVESWNIESSEKGKYYTISRAQNGRLVCECLGFKHRKNCRHIKIVMKENGIEENTGPNPLFLAACSYQLMGYHVIPIAPGEKTPLVSWKEWQTIQPSIGQLAEWWHKTPDANIGLVLGKNSQSELFPFAIDLDGGVETAKLLWEKDIYLPKEAPCSQTANGFHIFLSSPIPILDRIGILRSSEPRNSFTPKGNPRFAQVDIRGQGLIIAPPSLHPSGINYKWLEPLVEKPPMASQQLLDLISKE